MSRHRSGFRSRLVIAAATVPFVAAVAACGSGSTSGSASSPRANSLVLATALPSQGWEGDKCYNDLQTNPMVYDSLLKVESPDGNGVVGGLAKSYSYDKATHVYTFDLRPDAKFSNGQAVTAKDVVFSFDQWMSGKVSGIYYSTVKSAQAVSPSQVKVTMKQPDTFLPALLTWCTSTVYPDNFGGESAATFFQKPIGAGPFAVKSESDLTGPNEDIHLVPNKYYYGWPDGQPAVDSFEVKTISDPSQRALQFKAGDVDILDAVDSPTEAQIGSSHVDRAKPNTLFGMLANTKTGPTADPKVRAAISAALDRGEIAQALSDGSIAATGALAVNVPGAAEPSTPYSATADEEAAKSLMAQSKYPDGVSIDYLYVASDSDSSTAAQVAKNQLAKIGIDLKLQSVDNTSLNAKASSGKFQMASFAVSAISPTIFDPISFLQATAYPWSGADTSVVNAAFAAGTSTTVLGQQEAQAQKVQDDILSQNFLIGTYNSPHMWAVQPWVDGFHGLQYGFFYADTLATK